MNILSGRIRGSLRGDVYGGLTAAVVALPLALAFGVASGAGALSGLYGAILVGFFAAVFGGTPSQVSGPTGPMTVVMAATITQFSHDPALAFTVVMLGGVLQMLFGFAGIGRFIKLVPYPVVSGFMSGIGCIIIVLQLAAVLGHPMPEGSIIVKITALPSMFADPQWQTLALGALSLLIMYLTPRRIARLLPPPLLALIIGSLVGFLTLKQAPIIGDIPSGLPSPTLPTFSLEHLPEMLQAALVLAFLGSVDSLLTSLVADSLTGTHHKSNRELFGQGLGNLVAGLFGGIPGAGATMRTVVNVRAGGRTPVSGALHALVLLAVVLGVGSAARYIPLAVLGGILLRVGLDIIDWRYIKRAPHAPRAGVIIMLTTLLLTVIVDLITAVAVGIVMASLLFVKRMADVQTQSARLLADSDEASDLSDEESEILKQARGRIVLFHMEGPLSFGSARDISRMLTTNREKDVLVVDLGDVPFIDSSASIALEEAIAAIQREKDIVLLCGLQARVKDTLKRIGVSDAVPAEHILDSRLDALRRARALLEQG
ncbi:MAG: SulP family inorganic anion transporter [Burkholderiales bacterium]|jgi:SulP family sulfate permease